MTYIYLYLLCFVTNLGLWFAWATKDPAGQAYRWTYSQHFGGSAIFSAACSLFLCFGVFFTFWATGLGKWGWTLRYER